MEEIRIRLIENFVTWQGEGPDSGKRMVLLRFKTCNLNCPWCDTAVKMRVNAEATYLLKDIQNQILENNAGLMITGGEPTVNKHLEETTLLLNELQYSIANVETNGYRLMDLVQTVDPNKNIKYILSPKVFKQQDIVYYLELIEKCKSMDNLFVKYVYEGKTEDDEFLVKLESLPEFNSNKLWLMPEGVDKKSLIKNSEKVFDACERFNCNFSSRNHIIYGFV